MAATRSNERLVFDQRTLRMIIGALAFAFPAMVGAVTGKITTSISASYYEAEARNLFVGFLFIMGGLLISYKGHRRIVSNHEGSKLWVLVKRYEEDWISAVGGIAAIATALSPTACDGCAFDTQAKIHTVGAFLLFANVVYFCLIAFLRSLNEKLLSNNELLGSPVLKPKVDALVRRKQQADLNLLQVFWRFLTIEVSLFYVIFSEVGRQYDEAHTLPNRKISLTERREKFSFLFKAYGKKLSRGWIYVICGVLIAIVLFALVVLGFILPDILMHSKLTFIVETIALVLFGVAWMFASQIRYLRKPILFLKLRRRTKVLVQQPAT